MFAYEPVVNVHLIVHKNMIFCHILTDEQSTSALLHACALTPLLALTNTDADADADDYLQAVTCSPGV